MGGGWNQKGNRMDAVTPEGESLYEQTQVKNTRRDLVKRVRRSQAREGK